MTNLRFRVSFEGVEKESGFVVSAAECLIAVNLSPSSIKLKRISSVFPAFWQEVFDPKTLRYTRSERQPAVEWEKERQRRAI